jgi:hypothetical protein
MTTPPEPERPPWFVVILYVGTILGGMVAALVVLAAC